MRSAPSLLAMLHETEPAARPVVMPWEYVKMRRQAAGLTIAQVANDFWVRSEHRQTVESRFADLERENLRFKRLYITQGLRYVFSIDVYHQLANLPPHQHPQLCLACGWDQWTTQYDIRGEEVRWSEDDPDLCTRCDQLGRQKVIS